MIDIKLIRENPEEVKRNFFKKYRLLGDDRQHS
jgi:seryl-tRNA synthetase